MSKTAHHPPIEVRRAGLLGLIEGLLGIAYAAFLVFRELFVSHDSGAIFTNETRGAWLAYGTAAFFILIFGVVALAGFNLTRGKRWGRGPVVMLQMLLLPIAYYIVSAGQWAWAIPIGGAALLGLFLLFNRNAVAWATENY